jgi:hypothetical protein
VFLANCGGCHALSDAGTRGGQGPASTLKLTSDRVVDHHQQTGIMPSFAASSREADRQRGRIRLLVASQ